MNYPVAAYNPKSDWTKSQVKNKKIVFNPLNYSQDTVPDLTGMDLKDALYILENHGLVPVIRGKGYVREQSLLPGTPITKGNEIILHLSNGES